MADVPAERTVGGVSGRRAYVMPLKNRSTLLGGVVILAMALVSVLAPRLAPFDPATSGDSPVFQGRSSVPHSPPFWDKSGNAPYVEDPADPFAIYFRSLPFQPEHVLGTDGQARDMLSLLLYGLRFSLSVGLMTVALVAVVGVALGLTAGWRGGLWDDLVVWASDAAESVPALLAYALFASAVSGPVAGRLGSVGLDLAPAPATALVLSFVAWAPVARLVRARVIELRHAEWVFAARSIGARAPRILLRHILPYTVGTALVASSSQLPVLLLADGLLGAIGVGYRPRSGSLGELIFREFKYALDEPVFVLMPTALLLLMAFGTAALADGVRRALAPQ